MILSACFGCLVFRLSTPDSIKHHFESECGANFVKLLSLPRECVDVIAAKTCALAFVASPRSVTFSLYRIFGHCYQDVFKAHHAMVQVRTRFSVFAHDALFIVLAQLCFVITTHLLTR